MIKNIIFDLDGVLFDSFSQGFLNSEEGERVCKLKQEITADKLKDYVSQNSA